MLVDWTPLANIHPMGITTDVMALVVTTNFAVKLVYFPYLFLAHVWQTTPSSNRRTFYNGQIPSQKLHSSIGIQYMTTSSPRQCSISTTDFILYSI